MGIHNRQRRAAKQRRQRERASPPRRDHVSGDQDLASIIWEAAAALCDRDPAASELVAMVESAPRSLVAAALGNALAQQRAACLRHGWTETDVSQVTARRLRVPSGASEVDRNIRVLALLLGLPALPAVEARAASSQGDHGVLAKIRALLAKAESTTFPEEAEALTAKAQELMARHRIDHALVDAGSGQRPVGRRVWLDDPYADAKASLLSAVAAANRCRAIQLTGLGCSHVIGFSSDLDVVELLHTSLLVQATGVMAAAGPQVDRRGRSRTRSFRLSFLTAFAWRIGHRLREANAHGEAEGIAAHGPDLLPVLARRDDEVDAVVATSFPHLTRRSSRVTNEAGWLAGTLAADTADLSVGEALSGGSKVASSTELKWRHG